MIPPISPVPISLPADLAAAYLAAIASKPRHAFKDLVRDQHAPDHYVDIAALERDLDADNLPFTTVNHPVNGRQWQLEVVNGQISQGDGSSIDLMYAASMSNVRALKPLIFIAYPDGLAMVDGTHRIARALIDGRSTLSGRLVPYAHLGPYRIPEAEAEGRA